GGGRTGLGAAALFGCRCRLGLLPGRYLRRRRPLGLCLGLQVLWTFGAVVFRGVHWISTLSIMTSTAGATPSCQTPATPTSARLSRPSYKIPNTLQPPAASDGKVTSANTRKNCEPIDSPSPPTRAMATVPAG